MTPDMSGEPEPPLPQKPPPPAPMALVGEEPVTPVDRRPPPAIVSRGQMPLRAAVVGPGAPPANQPLSVLAMALTVPLMAMSPLATKMTGRCPVTCKYDPVVTVRLDRKTTATSRPSESFSSFCLVAAATSPLQ